MTHTTARRLDAAFDLQVIALRALALALSALAIIEAWFRGQQATTVRGGPTVALPTAPSVLDVAPTAPEAPVVAFACEPIVALPEPAPIASKSRKASKARPAPAMGSAARETKCSIKGKGSARVKRAEAAPVLADYATLTYRELQVRCKAGGFSARGSADELRARLVTYLAPSA